MAKQRRRDAQNAQFENRKQILRARRDREEAQQANRMLIALTVGLGLFLAFGLFREMYQIPNTPVAKVGGEVITAATYSKRIQYARQQLIVTLQNFRDLAASSSSDFLKNFAEQSRSRLPETTLDQLINESLIRQEATKRGIKVTDEDGDKRINDDLATAIAPQPTVVPEEPSEPTPEPTVPMSVTENSITFPGVGTWVTNTGGTSATLNADLARTMGSTSTLGSAPAGAESVTTTAGAVSDASSAAAEPTAGGASASTGEMTATGGVSATDGVSATSSATPTVSAKAIESAYRSRIDPMLQTTGLTKSDYRQIILQVIYRDRLQEKLAAEVPMTDKQVEAEYLVFETEDGAKTALGEMNKGKSWDDLRVEYKKPATETTNDATASITDTASGAAPIAVTPVTSTTSVSRTYALDISDRKWYTLDGVKSSWGASDGDAAKVLALRATTSLTEPIKGNQGYFVVRAFDVDAARALTDEELKTRKDGALDKWLEKVKTEVKIDRFPTESFTPAEPDWFTQNFDAIAAVSVPTIALPTGMPATIEPAGGAPPSGGDASGQAPEATKPSP